MRPFLQASSDVSGSFEILVNKRSASGTSVTRQAGSFDNGTLGGIAIALNAPGRLDIQMTLVDAGGGRLCGLERTVTI